jgi:hypothetical protein
MTAWPCPWRRERPCRRACAGHVRAGSAAGRPGPQWSTGGKVVRTDRGPGARARSGKVGSGRRFPTYCPSGSSGLPVQEPSRGYRRRGRTLGVKSMPVVPAAGDVSPSARDRRGAGRARGGAAVTLAAASYGGEPGSFVGCLGKLWSPRDAKRQPAAGSPRWERAAGHGSDAGSCRSRRSASLPRDGRRHGAA